MALCFMVAGSDERSAIRWNEPWATENRYLRTENPTPITQHPVPTKGDQMEVASNQWPVVSKAISTVAFSAMLFPSCSLAEAQQPAKVLRIGHLYQSSSYSVPVSDMYRQELNKLGYMEGQNIVFERRFANENLDQLPVLAAELVRLKVDVIVAISSSEIRAAMQATRTIPIFMLATPSDPVDTKFVASLARPGGNVTGLTSIARELGAKRLELLKEVSPQISRLALFRPARGQPGQEMKEIDTVAKALGIEVRSFAVRDLDALESALSAISKERLNSLYVAVTHFLIAHRARVIDFATKRQLPSVYEESLFVETGGLMSYGVDRVHLYRRAASLMDKILKGTKPADMPVERPTKFELVFNLKTAQQMDLAIPPNVLMRADRVIR
jgi:putative tryptophan/tyrosine transport system substrate-binding protein